MININIENKLLKTENICADMVLLIHKKMGVVNSYERPFKREKQTKNNGKPLGKFITSKLFYFEKKKVIKILSISNVNRPMIYW